MRKWKKKQWYCREKPVQQLMIKTDFVISKLPVGTERKNLTKSFNNITPKTKGKKRYDNELKMDIIGEEGKECLH